MKTEEIVHTSDCLVHNEPAFRNGPCNCGVEHGTSDKGFYISLVKGHPMKRHFKDKAAAKARYPKAFEILEG